LLEHEQFKNAGRKYWLVFKVEFCWLTTMMMQSTLLKTFKGRHSS